MYNTLGIHWASALPGFLAITCLPFPFLFYKCGAHIRKKCKYATEADAFMQRLHNRATQRPETADETCEASSNNVSGSASQLAAVDAEDGSEKEEAEPRQYQEMKTEKEAEGDKFKKVQQRQSSQSQRSHKIYRSHRSARDEYYDNPYEIDRVHSRERFGPHRSRAESRASRQGSEA